MAIRFARRAFVASVALVLAVMSAAPAKPQGLSLIRDAEIESTIRAYAAPLFGAAGLSADAVRVHIVNDSSLNAFVAGGLNLFINTGMLAAADEPGEIIGVIAHETGHIAGGHLIRTQQALKNASAEMILAAILGAGAILAGSGEAGGAILQGGSAAAQQSFFSYSQAQEQAADQAGVRFLESLGQSASGLLEMFHRLEDQELLAISRQDPYLRSHPLTRQRIRFIRNHVETSAHSATPYSPVLLEAHKRMVAKLTAFLGSPTRTLRAYPTTDGSLYARYARAIAYHKMPDLDRALGELNSLLADYPDDPWFHELKGQVLFENGRIRDAVPPYSRSVELQPNAALLRLGLARAQIESGDASLNSSAIDHLKVATRLERNEASHWHFLGVAYGRADELALSSLALAEASYLRGRMGQAKHHAKRAADGLPQGSPNWIRAEDIRNAAETAEQRDK